MGKWDYIQTKHGYHADEVISALQKDIRRGNEEQAMFWAYELVVSKFAKIFWERILTIATEDVGFGNPQAVIMVNTLKKTFYADYTKSGDQMIHALFAAAYLARSDKDRYIDEAKHFIRSEFDKGELPKIPDYAIDKHTKKGKEMGRGSKHFIEVGAKIHPISKKRNTKYLKYLKRKYAKEVLPANPRHRQDSE